MGMFDGLKNWFDKTFGKKQKLLSEGQGYSQISAMGTHIGSNIYIKDVITDEYAHQNPYGQETRLYTVRVSRLTDETLSGYPVTFELPAYMSLDDALSNGALNVLLSNKAKPQMLNEKALTNIGGLTILQDQHGQSQWGFHDSTPEVNNYINYYLKAPMDAALNARPTDEPSVTQPQQPQVVHNEGAFLETEPAFKYGGKFAGEISYKINNPENGNVTELRLKENINPVVVSRTAGNLDYVYTAFRQRLGKSFNSASYFNMQLEEIQFALPYQIENLVDTMNGYDNSVQNASEHARLLGSLVDRIQAVPSSMIEGIKQDENGNPVYLSYQEASNLYRTANPAVNRAKQAAIMGTYSSQQQERTSDYGAR